MALPTETEMELYCSNKKALIRTMCRTGQWSGINEGDINDWLHKNFHDTKGRYLAIKIFLHSLYYSETNIIELLRFGIYSKIFGDKIKEKIISERNIYRLKSDIESEINDAISHTLFVPLLDKDSPTESGNLMIRYLNHKLGIKASNTAFHFQISDEMLSNFKTIVIVDDCLGSGQQLYNFWNCNSAFERVKTTAKALGIEMYYLILIANEDVLIDLQLNGELAGLKVRICERLTSENRVFEVNNNIWNGDQDELNEAIRYFDSIEKSFDVPRLGYNNLDYSVFIHSTTPDWSLPIFWKENSDWKPLVKRKNSITV